jgi:repressor LexA
MNDDALSPRQQQILDFIAVRLQTSGAPPTRAEIALAFGFRSANAAEEHLRTLARKGAIELLPGRSRGIRLPVARISASALEATDKRRELPLIGQVAAGSPILAIENVERELALDPALFHPPADYLLRVRGLSMRDAGILDGDLLAVHRSAQAQPRQIVVARLGDEVTVKRIEFHDTHIRLLPANPDFTPLDIAPDREDFAIEGLAVGVLRAW